MYRGLLLLILLILFFLICQLKSSTIELLPWQIELSQNNFNDPFLCISLGSDCEGSLHLKRLNLRKASFPFDWIITGNVDKLIKVIESGFDAFFLNNLFKLEYLEQIGVGQGGLRIILNNYYDFIFVHDFEVSQTIEEMLPFVKDKYVRRFNRLNAVCNSDKYIFFFRKNIGKEQALKLSQAISKKWPKLRYKLIAIDLTRESKQDWKGPGIYNFFIGEEELDEVIQLRDYKKHYYRWVQADKWDSVFNKIGLTKKVISILNSKGTS